MSNIVYQGGANHEQFQTSKFLECLNSIKIDRPTMIELGSNDCHYSILFNQFFKDECTNICVECCENLLHLGKQNITNNKIANCFFEHAYLGEIDTVYLKEHPDTFLKISDNKINLQFVINKYNLHFISMLHMDIQGSEKFVLEEIEALSIPIQFIFVSTHKNTLFGNTHLVCQQKLTDLGYHFHFNDEHSGGHGDGLLIGEKIF